MAKKRIRFCFFGDVQGVGFRYRAYHVADALGVTGWVRNEYDGSVTLEAQGNEAALGALLREIEGGLYIRVERVEQQALPLVPGEASFQIRE